MVSEIDYNFLFNFQVFPPSFLLINLFLTELVISDYTSVV